MDIKEVASQAETILENVMKAEPTIATVLDFIPGAAPIEALVQPAIMAIAPAIEQALKAIAADNIGGAVDPIAELMKHILPGLPNSPTLSG